MDILSKLPFDLQEYILVKIMKLYKLRQGKYIRQIDKNKYTFLEYVMRPSVDKNPRYYIDRNGLFNHKFFIKNLYDRKGSNVDGDIVNVRIEHTNNIYYYTVGIYRLKLKDDSIATNTIRKDIYRKDIYHKGPLADDYFWDVFEFCYEVK
jgi:hypothetical protein